MADGGALVELPAVSKWAAGPQSESGRNFKSSERRADLDKNLGQFLGARGVGAQFWKEGLGGWQMAPIGVSMF